MQEETFSHRMGTSNERGKMNREVVRNDDTSRWCTEWTPRWIWKRCIKWIRHEMNKTAINTSTMTEMNSGTRHTVGTSQWNIKWHTERTIKWCKMTKGWGSGGGWKQQQQKIGILEWTLKWRCKEYTTPKAATCGYLLRTPEAHAQLQDKYVRSVTCEKQ